MNRNILNTIQNLRSVPSISILMPTHRSFPENQQDKIRLKNLVNDAASKLKKDFSEKDTGLLIKKFNSLTEEIDFNHLEDGLAVFISNESFYTFTFGFPVEERMIIADNFVTRDLVFGLNRTQPYYAVVIDDKNTRIFNCVRDRLTESAHPDLPLKNVVQDIREGDFPETSYNDRIRENDERTKNHLRDTFKILKELTEGADVSLVICGTEKQISFFKEITSPDFSIIGEVTGNYGSSSAAELAKLVWPEAKKGFASRRKKILDLIEPAIGAKKFATGIQEIWNLALEGRGHYLLTEINYTVPGIIKDDHVEISEKNDEGANNDIIDEIIESVFSKGGKVVFFDNGTLEKFGKIALILRY